MTAQPSQFHFFFCIYDVLAVAKFNLEVCITTTSEPSFFAVTTSQPSFRLWPVSMLLVKYDHCCICFMSANKKVLNFKIARYLHF